MDPNARETILMTKRWHYFRLVEVNFGLFASIGQLYSIIALSTADRASIQALADTVVILLRLVLVPQSIL
jgi:hypothetical protein